MAVDHRRCPPSRPSIFDLGRWGHEGDQRKNPLTRRKVSVWVRRESSTIDRVVPEQEERRGERRADLDWMSTTSTNRVSGALAGADPEVRPSPCRKNYGADQSEMLFRSPRNPPSNHGNGDTALPLRPPILDAHRRRTMGEWQRPISGPSEIGKCCCPWPWESMAPPHRPAPGHHWPSSPWQPLSLTARGNAPNAGLSRCPNCCPGMDRWA